MRVRMMAHSKIPVGPGRGVRTPLRKEAWASLASAGSAPKTFSRGLRVCV